MKNCFALLLTLLFFTACRDDTDRFSGSAEENRRHANAVESHSKSQESQGPPFAIHSEPHTWQGPTFDIYSATHTLQEPDFGWHPGTEGVNGTSHMLHGGKTSAMSKPEGLQDEITAVERKSHHKSKRKKSVEKFSVIPDTIKKRELASRMKKMDILRANHITLDLNEPISRQYLTDKVDAGNFQSMIMLAGETLLEFDFDNDILDYTDRFYTNGLKVELTAPWLSMNPMRITMVPYWRAGINYYGLTVVQNMYTPSTTKTGGILYGDRPYSAYLYVGSKKSSLDPIHHFKQTSELDLGIIGPNSYGGWVQRAFHNTVPTNHEPLGWDYQIQNDLVLNYNYTLEMGLLNYKHAELILKTGGQLGTLYTNLAGGFQVRAGWFNSYFKNLGISKKRILKENGLRRSQFCLFLKGSGKVIGYDATLQGGLFNRSSVYTIPGEDISRFVFQSSLGAVVSFGGFRFNLEQFLLSPEFSNGLWHKWVNISMVFCL